MLAKYNKKPKYGNRKVRVNGEAFDSKKEYSRYCELKLMLQAGLISGLQRQVKYELLPSQRVNGKVIEKSVTYIADFIYYRDGKLVVEDTKGFRTKDYILKRKMMLYFHNIIIEEV